MILKTQPDSPVVCDNSRNQPGNYSDAAVGQDTQRLTLSRAKREIGEVDEHQEQNQGGGDISLNSNDAATGKRDQRPMAVDWEKTGSLNSTTVRLAINSTVEDTTTTDDTPFYPYDGISNRQELHDAERQKGTNNDNGDESMSDGDGNDDIVMRSRIERLWTPDRGRIMVARSKIPRGSFLYRLEAQATVCDTDNRRRRCASCFKRLNFHAVGDVTNEVEEDARRVNDGGICVCEGCGEIWYCDQVCRDRDWAVMHAAECRFLQALYQGVQAAASSNKNGNTDNDDKDKEDKADWMKAINEPHRNTIARFSQQDFTPYTQDLCRLLIRTLTLRFHELTDPTFTMQGVAPTDPPYLESTDPDHPQGPLPYSYIEDMVTNQATYSKEQIEGEFWDVLRILDAFQTHLEAYYLPRLQQLVLRHPRRQQKGAGVGVGVESGIGFGDLPKRPPPPRRLLETELMDLIMREECNSFGMYEYPPFPLLHTVTDNSKIGYALGFFTRQHLYGFNHSCSPNLFHLAHNKHLLFYAGRDILPGEEINISYVEFGPHYRISSAATSSGAEEKVGPGVDQEGKMKTRCKMRETFEKRRAILKRLFHFDCECARCTYEAALYSSSDDNDIKVKEEGLSEEVEGLSKEVEGERFLREGLSCEREGCFGFYAPPAVLRALQDHDGDNRSGKDDDEGGSCMDVDGQWGCVACGHRQS